MRVVHVEPTQICEDQDLLANDTHIGYVSDLKWLIGPHSRTIAFASTNGIITLHDVDNPTAVRRLASGHTRMVNSLSVNTFNPQILISGGQDSTVRYWDLRTLQNVATVKGPDATRRVQFSSVDGARFCAIFDTGTLSRWDARNLVRADRRVAAHSGSGLCLDFHPSMDVVLTGGRDRAMRVWDLRHETADHTPLKPLYEIKTSGAISSAIWRRPLANEKISDIADLPVACASLSVGDYRLHVFNLRRKFVPERVIDSHSGPVMGLAWAGDGLFGSRVPLEEDSSDSDSDKEYNFLPASSTTAIHPPPPHTVRPTKRKRRQRGVLWACSRDMTFRAHDVRHSCPSRPIHNLSHQAFAWSPVDDEFTFIGLDKRRLRRDGMINIPVNPLQDAGPLPSPPIESAAVGIWNRRNSQKPSLAGTPSSLASSTSSTSSTGSSMMRMLLPPRQHRPQISTIATVPTQVTVSDSLAHFNSGLDDPGFTENNNALRPRAERRHEARPKQELRIDGVRQDGIGFSTHDEAEEVRQVRSV